MATVQVDPTQVETCMPELTFPELSQSECSSPDSLVLIPDSNHVFDDGFCTNANGSCRCDMYNKNLFTVLRYICQKKIPSGLCIFMQSLCLQKCNLDVNHIPGKQNLVAEALSQC